MPKRICGMQRLKRANRLCLWRENALNVPGLMATIQRNELFSSDRSGTKWAHCMRPQHLREPQSQPYHYIDLIISSQNGIYLRKFNSQNLFEVILRECHRMCSKGCFVTISVHRNNASVSGNHPANHLHKSTLSLVMCRCVEAFNFWIWNCFSHRLIKFCSIPLLFLHESIAKPLPRCHSAGWRAPLSKVWMRIGHVKQRANHSCLIVWSPNLYVLAEREGEVAQNHHFAKGKILTAFIFIFRFSKAEYFERKFVTSLVDGW